MALKRDARGRLRDYSAERARRNELARQRGFSSLDALHKAVKAGQYPSAREIRRDPEKRREAALISQRRIREANRARPKPPQLPPEAELDKSDAEIHQLNREWSRRHSRQSRTEYNPRWGVKRKRAYYNAFVRDFRVPNDERDFQPTYDYLLAYDLADEVEFSDNPYRGE